MLIARAPADAGVATARNTAPMPEPARQVQAPVEELQDPEVHWWPVQLALTTNLTVAVAAALTTVPLAAVVLPRPSVYLTVSLPTKPGLGRYTSALLSPAEGRTTVPPMLGVLRFAIRMLGAERSFA